MRRVFTVLLILIPMLMLSSASAVTMVDITVSRVALRNPLYGKNIGLVRDGDVLTGLGETFDQEHGLLWYHVQSDAYGEGYVCAKHAAPVCPGYANTEWSDEAQTVPEEWWDFQREWLTYLYERGFLCWDES